MGQEVSNSLSVNMGDIAPGGSKMVEWMLQSSLKVRCVVCVRGGGGGVGEPTDAVGHPFETQPAGRPGGPREGQGILGTHGTARGTPVEPDMWMQGWIGGEVARTTQLPQAARVGPGG